LGMYREWKKTEFPKKKSIIYESGNNKAEMVDLEMDGKKK